MLGRKVSHVNMRSRQSSRFLLPKCQIVVTSLLSAQIMYTWKFAVALQTLLINHPEKAKHKVKDITLKYYCYNIKIFCLMYIYVFIILIFLMISLLKLPFNNKDALAMLKNKMKKQVLILLLYISTPSHLRVLWYQIQI